MVLLHGCDYNQQSCHSINQEWDHLEFELMQFLISLVDGIHTDSKREETKQEKDPLSIY